MMKGPTIAKDAVDGLSIAPKKVFKFIGETLSLGDRLSELLYGVLMVSAISGLVVWVGPRDESGIEYMLVVLFISIIMWGLLDGISYALLGAANRAERETLLESLQEEKDLQKRRAAIEEDLGDTFLARLDDESRSRIVELVDQGLPREGEKMRRNRLTAYEKKIVVAAFLLDFIPLLILVVPYLYADSLATAALTSHTIALVMFIFIGFFYAKYANLNKWKGAFAAGLIGLVVIVFSDATGLVLI